MSENTPPNYDALIDAHLDGVLTDPQAEQLHTWLMADPEHAVLFARRAQDHMQLRQIFSGDALARLAESVSEGFAQEEPEQITLDMLSLLEDPSDDIHLVDLTQRLDRERRSRHDPRLIHPHGRPRPVPEPRPLVNTGGLVIAMGLAAAAVVALLIYPVLTANRTPSSTTPPVTINPVPVPGEDTTQMPPAPAVLVASHRAEWHRGTGSVQADGSMGAGVYTLHTGFASIAMADGASLIIEGPARFEVASASQVVMARGLLTASVPDHGKRFVVETPAGRVQNRGADFGLEVVDDQSIEVHVMAGEVTATLASGAMSRSMRVGDAIRMDRAHEHIELVPAHDVKFARDWEQVERSVRVSDAVRYLYDTPGSVQSGALEDNHVLFILPERRGVEVPALEVLCDFLQPGRYDRLPRSVGAVPSDVAVDSYLLHYDRVGTPGQLIAVHGTIHFDRPIVGVIADAKWLGASDSYFAKPGTAYPRSTYQGRGFEGLNRFPVTQDVVEISEDRRTLTVRLATSTNIDQLRVLVEAGP